MIRCLNPYLAVAQHLALLGRLLLLQVWASSPAFSPLISRETLPNEWFHLFSTTNKTEPAQANLSDSSLSVRSRFSVGHQPSGWLANFLTLLSNLPFFEFFCVDLILEEHNLLMIVMLMSEFHCQSLTRRSLGCLIAVKTSCARMEDEILHQASSFSPTCKPLISRKLHASCCKLSSKSKF